MAVDNSTGSSLFKGRVYVCWSRFIGNAANIMLTWSDDPTTEPLTGWKTTPIQLNPNSQTGFVQGSQVAVGPDGTVYVVYDVSVTGGHETFFTKSTDGGVHWSDGVKPPALPPVARSMQTAPFAPIGFKASYRYDSFPYLAVNPVNGDIYVVYPDQPPTTNSAIEFIRSADGGAHFSTPFVLNDVTMTGERLMPSITADVRNNIHVSWFDTRNGANAQTYDIYAARGSLASGTLTWSTSNLRVTPSSVAVSKFNNFIGDYAGIASSEINDGGTLWGFAVPVWSGKNPGTQILQARLLAYTTP
jgi:hypothetical protein